MLMLCSPLSVLVSLYFFLPHVNLAIAVDFPAPYAPTDNLAVNCGSLGNSTTPDGRVWIGDIGLKFTQLQQPKGKSITSKAFDQHSDTVHTVPYITARISRSPFSYSFKANPGQKFIRLHFYPAFYPGFERSKAFFTVKAGPYTLLSNFSASLTADALGKKSFVTEFCLNVVENQALTITFFPSPSSTSDVSYAFINGIEIVSMPTGLYYTQGNDPGATVVGQNYRFYIGNNTALEAVKRLNVGGSSISLVEDSGMYREWSEDLNHLVEPSVIPVSTAIPIGYTTIPTYIAPEKVYQTAWLVSPARNSIQVKNFTWKLPVDLGFRYLIRLHFCELQYGIKDKGQRQFCIIINKQIAEDYADIIKWSGGNGVAVYKDYVAMMEGDRMGSKRDLLITLQPHSHKADAILNGVEVFKLSNPDNNLAGPNAEPLVDALTSKMPKPPKKASVFLFVNSIVNRMVVLITFVSVFVHQLCIWAENSGETNMLQATPKEACRRFSLAEMLSATRNFDDTFIVGCGGFGKVYKGFINNGATIVAVKRLNPMSRQGPHEFWTEIEMLSKLRHTHLVSLVGYCDDSHEMILVYEYMAHGTLADHIHKANRNDDGVPCLTWEKRLNICIGAARGLNHLHAGTQHRVIHRDVKSTNILLAEDWVAKISDFGLSKMTTTTQFGSYVSTNVKGTFGYLDPEYFLTHKLTRKSDVYAFGVVLLEVLCGRRAVDMKLEEDQYNLAIWAQDCTRKGIIHQIVDPHLKTQILPNCLKVFVEVAMKCLHNHSKDRPTMDDVVGSLELALAAQESSSSCTDEGIRLGAADIYQIVGAIHLDGADLCLENPAFEQDHTILSSNPTNLTITKLDQSMTLTAKGKDSQREKKKEDDRGWLSWWLRKQLRRSPKKVKEKSSVTLEDLCRHFPLSEIRAATNNFSEVHLVGGPSYFDKLYKGCAADSILMFAIRRFIPNSSLEDYCRLATEILDELQPKLHHVQIPVGCYIEGGEMIIVYDYMGNGSLGDYLFRMNGDPLPWKKRLEICIKVARGLQQQHVHSNLSPMLIHHLDINTNKIMLDNDWVPKFLLDIDRFPCDKRLMYSEVLVPSNVANMGESLTHHVSTRYYAPEYILSGGVMEDSHVYSFGVVLLDVLYGRNALGPMLHCGHWTSVDCFKSGMSRKCIGHIIDPYLMGHVTPECFREFVKIINDCLLHERMKRPSMADVVGRLEFILELLETSGNHGQFSIASEEDRSEASFKEAIYRAYDNALFNNNDNIASEDDRSEVSFKEAVVYRACNNTLFNNNVPLFIDRDYIVMNPDATSFSGPVNKIKMSSAASDDSDYHSSNESSSVEPSLNSKE